MALGFNKVAVGLSGGVDSAVAAWLLKSQGYDVQAVFMKNWVSDDDPSFCSLARDLADAEAVALQLNIPLHVVDFSQQYWDRVFSVFLKTYQAGWTPNPDSLCNQEVKFSAFLDYALSVLKVDGIATGHYAASEKKNGLYWLKMSRDQGKDQTYFLYAIGQTALSQALFPLADLLKQDVRAMASQQGFLNSQKKDSTGICFIGERRFQAFLSQYIRAQKGSIESLEGLCLGEHQGAVYYTIGQRQGLNLGARRGLASAPWYVVDKNIAENKLIVVQGRDHPALYHRTLYAESWEWLTRPLEQGDYPYACQAKIRYRQSEQPCFLSQITEKRFKLQFENPQWAVAPGQSVVLYQKPFCLGGGVIVDRAP